MLALLIAITALRGAHCLVKTKGADAVSTAVAETAVVAPPPPMQMAVSNQYCSFFENRAPGRQPSLKNCTWFKENSCCLQAEIDATFNRVKPLQGASASCQLYMNYLMCYICAPNQNLFYSGGELTVCNDFCDKFYEACRSAILKGYVISELYTNGHDFCKSRQYRVGSYTEIRCFRYDDLTVRGRSARNEPNFHIKVSLLIMSFYCVASAIKAR